MPPDDLDPRNMFNPEWQTYNINNRKNALKYIDCLDIVLIGFLKHLIHLFVVLIILSFAGMLYVLLFSEDLPDKYEIKRQFDPDDIPLMYRTNAIYATSKFLD